LINYQKIHSDDRVVNMIQDNLIKVLQPITSNELLNGSILTKISLVSGSTNYIAHGLGRPLIGWYPVRVRASATIYDTQDTNLNPSSTLALHTSSNVTVDIAVF
jgi:hypothetical protein